MKKLRTFTCLFILLNLFACSKKETLTPSESQPLYTLPQGNEVYDKDIVDFYKKYGTYILYKFNENDFRWRFSPSLLEKLATEADPAYVDASLNSLDKYLFAYYDENTLQEILPFKILLCSKIVEIEQFTGDTLNIPMPATWSISHIAFGHSNERFDNLTEEELLNLKGSLHGALWACAAARGKLLLPKAFDNMTNYGVVTPLNFKNYGLFSDCFTVYEALFDYVMRITSRTKEEFQTEFLGPVNDPTGIFQRKYDALIQQFLTYGIDLHAIGNAQLN